MPSCFMKRIYVQRYGNPKNSTIAIIGYSGRLFPPLLTIYRYIEWVIDGTNLFIAGPFHHFLDRGLLAIHEDTDAVNLGRQDGNENKRTVKQDHRKELLP